ncbi:MAG: hypothetical protein ACJ8C7_14760, partial [Microvirga sp.]
MAPSRDALDVGDVEGDELGAPDSAGETQLDESAIAVIGFRAGTDVAQHPLDHAGGRRRLLVGSGADR